MRRLRRYAFYLPTRSLRQSGTDMGYGAAADITYGGTQQLGTDTQVSCFAAVLTQRIVLRQRTS
eukprot:1642940-Rhodomonas_salina.2